MGLGGLRSLVGLIPCEHLQLSVLHLTGVEPEGGVGPGARTCLAEADE